MKVKTGMLDSEYGEYNYCVLESNNDGEWFREWLVVMFFGDDIVYNQFVRSENLETNIDAYMPEILKDLHYTAEKEFHKRLGKRNERSSSNSSSLEESGELLPSKTIGTYKYELKVIPKKDKLPAHHFGQLFCDGELLFQTHSSHSVKYIKLDFLKHILWNEAIKRKTQSKNLMDKHIPLPPKELKNRRNR